MSFFSKIELTDEILSKKKSLNKEKTSKIFTCEDCDLNVKNKVSIIGRGKNKILIVTEFPVIEKIDTKVKYLDTSFKYFSNELKKLGYDLYDDFYTTSAIRCKKVNKKINNKKCIKACRQNLIALMDKVNSVILLGSGAFDSLIGLKISGRMKGMSFIDFVGDCIEDQEFRKKVCVLNHPFYCVKALNERKDKSVEFIYLKNLKNALSFCVDCKFNFYDYNKNLYLFKNVNKVNKILKELTEKRLLAFDYETTGKKFEREGQNILVVSFSDGTNSYAFPFFEDNKEFIFLMKKILFNKEIKKICQNFKFEQKWTKWIFGNWVNGMYWDTQLAAHFLQNKKRTNLKYQVYKEFGVIYDDYVDKFISSVMPSEDVKSGNAFNCLPLAELDKVLKYSALDSFFTFKLFEKQRNIRLFNNEKNGYQFFMNNLLSIAASEMNGICIDEEKLKLQNKVCENKLIEYEKLINESKELKKFWDKDEDFNLRSLKQLAYLFFEKMKFSVLEKTETGFPKIDKNTLENLDNNLAKYILKYKKWEKIKNTFIAQYIREIVDGKVHPSFNFGSIDTYRSSCNSPNIQNNIKRDFTSMKILRSFIVPRSGNRLKEYDYKGIEVAVAASYTKDKNLISYVIDKEKDMHRDIACQLFFRTKDNFLKEERFDAKNGFVFPSFYGSYWKQIASNIWEKVLTRSDTTLLNLKKNGIKNFNDFEQHVKEIEQDFWENRFAEYSEWKKRTWYDYQKKGYLDSFTGFRYHGDMRRNQVLNYMIQGSAFHCLMYMYGNVEKRVRKKFKNTFFIGEIHDAALVDVCPIEEEELDYLVWLWGTQKIREYWEWIEVPLEIEQEVSEINGSWAEMKELGYLKF